MLRRRHATPPPGKLQSAPVTVTKREVHRGDRFAGGGRGVSSGSTGSCTQLPKDRRLPSRHPGSYREAWRVGARILGWGPGLATLLPPPPPAPLDGQVPCTCQG